jgi:hypothetical protein
VEAVHVLLGGDGGGGPLLIDVRRHGKLEEAMPTPSR